MCSRKVSKRPGNRIRAPYRIVFAAFTVVCACTSARAASLGLTIDATFDTSGPGALNAAEQAAINAGISNIQASITSPNNLTVSIYFSASTSISLGQSTSSIDTPFYYDFYNDLKAVDTSADQLTALNSLGAAPADTSSDSPVPGAGAKMFITTAEARNLGMTGFGTAPGVSVSGVSGAFDGSIELNTSITSPPGTLSNSNIYSLQSVAEHEIDEVLGIGGTGSTLGTGNQSLGEPGDLDLFRYSASGTRSYTTSTSATAYFSIDGGQTILSFFNQSGSGDYSDWNNSGHAGFAAQVQDAFATPNITLTLGTNELKALNVIGYRVVAADQVVAPEPSTLALAGVGLLACSLLRRRQSANR